MSHIERRANLWYAVLTIPIKAREHLGKAKFVKSLGTADKREAQRLAPPLVAKWKSQIRQAGGEVGAIADEAQRWKDALSQATGHERETLESVLLADTEKKEAEDGYQAAKTFYGLATGVITLTSSHFEDWKAQLDLEPKTIDQMVKDARLLISRFGTLEEITKRSAKTWMDELGTQGKTLSSLNRIIFACRNYWRHLRTIEAVPPDSDPFFKVLAISKTAKNNATGSWVPFEASEVATLWKAAVARKDQPLADLIALAAYSGSRIEELCSLKVGAVNGESFKIIDAKTAAGIREVPIHSELKPLIERLKKASTDGYLISGLALSKYGDRSNAIGKRFGRLKSSLGFSPQHVFHSIRKTLTTQLENAGISENLAADIVGHEKPRITYGLYSGGATLAAKKEAIEKVRYPFPIK
jgi:integrase